MAEINVEKKIYCHGCKNITYHRYILKEDKPLQYIEEGDHIYGYTDKYSIIQCKGCHKISFLREYLDEDIWNHYNWMKEQAQHDMEYFEEYDPADYYSYPEPPELNPLEEKSIYQQLLEQRRANSFDHVPKQIKKLHKEMLLAFSNGSHLLCGIGLRMMIEAICEDLDIRNPKDKEGNVQKDGKGNIIKLNLYHMIKSLQSKSLITNAQRHVLDQIREMGNDTVHVLQHHPSEVLFQAILIIDDILMNVYEYKQWNLYTKESAKSQNSISNVKS